jgi:hypothetical protein
MLVNQAGWQVSQKLTIPENMRLITLPHRSPALNPAEPSWEELREKNFANKIYRGLDEGEDNLCRGLNDLAKDPDKLRSMTNFPCLNVTYYSVCQKFLPFGGFQIPLNPPFSKGDFICDSL